MASLVIFILFLCWEAPVLVLLAALGFKLSDQWLVIKTLARLALALTLVNEVLYLLYRVPLFGVLYGIAITLPTLYLFALIWYHFDMVKLSFTDEQAYLHGLRVRESIRKSRSGKRKP